MVDCIKCKHWITNNNDYYECELDALKPTDSFPKLDCENYEKETEKEIQGKKYDTGKNRMGLMCENFSRALWKVAEVSTFGATKYGDDTWQNLSNPKKRYMDALCRHLFKHLQGEQYDSESGLLHLQHMAWNTLALLEFELKDNDDNRCYALKKHLELSGVEGIRQALKENEESEDNNG